MATIKQLLQAQQQVESAQCKLDACIDKRRELIRSLGLNTPAWNERRQETFVSIDDQPARLWVDNWGNLEVEYLKF